MEWMLMPLRRYAEFSGRSRPQEFWMFVLLQAIIYVVLTVLTVAIGLGAAGMSSFSSNSASPAGLMGLFAALGIFALFYVIVGLGFFLPNLAVASRRLHDTDRSGWWQMLYWGPWLLGVAISVVNFSSMSTGGTPSSGLAVVGGIMSLLQLVGLLVLIVFYCLPGTPGLNRFGPDPMMRDIGAVFS